MPKKKTTEVFLQELYTCNPSIELLSKEYINSSTKLLFQCRICGFEWQTQPEIVLSGHGCPRCSKEKRRQTTTKSNEQFLAELKEVDNSIIPLQRYQNAQTKIAFRCMNCGHEWESKPYLVLQNHGCPVCSHKRGGEKIALSPDDFIHKANEALPNIEVIGEYYRSNAKVKCRCKTCGHTWHATPNNILRKQTGCSKCNRVYHSSFPEQAIFYYILKAFPDAINGYNNGFKNTELDIYVPDLKLGIEYDGAYYHNKSTLNKEIRKYKLCQQRGIKLFRIRFDEQDNIADKIIITNKSKPKDEYEELRRVICTLLVEIGIDGLSVDLERDQNEIYSQYLKTKEEKALSIQYPEIAIEWNKQRNGSVTAQMVSSGSTKKFWWKCSKCGYEWETTVVSRTGKNKSGCPRCSNHLTRTNDEFLAALKEINDTITTLDPFVNVSTDIRCHCSVCGNSWITKPVKLLSGHGCPECAIESSKKSHEEFISRVISVNPNIEILSKYDGLNKKVDCKCRLCGYEWKSMPKTLYAGKGCAKCAGVAKKTNAEFVSELKRVNPTIQPQETYKSAHTKIKFKCGICGTEWLAKPNTILCGTGCPTCNASKKTKEQFIADLHNKNPGISVIGDYKGCFTPIKLKCDKCGFKWEQKPTNILKTPRCPNCEKPKGRARSVLQLDDSGNLIAEFNSLSSAAKQLDIDISSISAAAKGNLKHAGGYCWQYKQND